MRRKVASIIIRELLRISHKTLCKITWEYRLKDLKLLVPCGLFNPVFTVSTSLIISALDIIKPHGIVLDFGCGTGVLAIYVAKSFNVEKVICYDINPKAIRTAHINSALNEVENKIMFVNNPEDLYFLNKKVNLVVSNPPYLPLDPSDELDLGWCGGGGLEVIREVALRSRLILKSGGLVVLSYSSVSGLREISQITKRFGFKEILLIRKRTPLDEIYVSIYRTGRPLGGPLLHTRAPQDSANSSFQPDI